jgi:hypothetical protein
MVPGDRACRVSYQNLFFVHLNELLNDGKLFSTMRSERK